MPVHPFIQDMLKLAANAPPIESLSVTQVRKVLKAAYAAAGAPTEVAATEDRSIVGPHGDIPIRIYTPQGRGPFPLLMFFHGSGFVTLDLDTHDELCRKLCRGAGCVVVSVDYRLAPEHKFPLPADDCLAATVWAAANAKTLNATDRIALSGDSAGGCLAASTAATLRDRGGPEICGQVLFYPVTDYPDPEPQCYRDFAKGYGLTANGMRWFWGHYLKSEADARDPRCSPLRASDFAGLPPTVLFTAEYDVLRDEGEAYAERLRAAGIPVQMKRCLGLNHGFLKWDQQIEEVAGALDHACDWLRRRMALQTTYP